MFLFLKHHCYFFIPRMHKLEESDQPTNEKSIHKDEAA